MDQKVLRWNFIFQYGWVITNIINSVLLLPFYLGNINNDTLGIWLATGSILGWMTLADPGIGEVLQQRIAELFGKQEHSPIGKTIGSGFMASAIILLISLIVGFVCYFFIGSIINKDISSYFNLSMALVVSIVATGASLVSFAMSGINQGLQNSAQVAIAALSANFLFLIINLVLLFAGFGVMSIALANLSRAIFLNAWNIASMKRLLDRMSVRIVFDRLHFRKFIGIFSFTSASKIITGIAYSVDMIILARFIPPAMITMYEINKRPMNITYSLVGRHCIALLPLISHAKGKDDKPSILQLVNRQFRLYAYAAMFAALFFCLHYEFIITLWTDKDQYAGTVFTYLLAISMFASLICYFIANIAYALGDIKMNSLYNILRGVVYGCAAFFAIRSFGITGVLVTGICITVTADLFFYSYRLHKLGYLPRSQVRQVLSPWAIILPVSLAGAWALKQLSWNFFLTASLFSVFFLALVLLSDAVVRSMCKQLLQKFLKYVTFKTSAMPKFIVMLRVKDGISFVHEWLACFEKLADEIVVLDNGSTDGTYEILKAHPKVTDIIRTEGYDEGRDKNLLYARMRLRKPDWCLWVDVDEVFEPRLTRAHFNKLMNRPFINKYAFRRFHFIDREHFAGSWFRLNYSAGHDRIMWREAPTGYFQNLVLDSPNVKGIRGLKVYTNYRLKHLGYISKEIVDRKFQIYKSVAPERQDLHEMYLHNERRIKWRDERNHPKVLLLNGLLNILLLRQLAHKAYWRAVGVFRKPQNALT
ncbi:MAG TPA: glycosyltransferase family 2 protein [Chitinophagaceae bacterium]|nr:glycosyltransferase family 2 protein [Chitinophagaceae bacterium]